MIRNQEVLLISDLVNACVGNFLVLFLSNQADNAGNLFEVFANFTTLTHIFRKLNCSGVILVLWYCAQELGG